MPPTLPYDNYHSPRTIPAPDRDRRRQHRKRLPRDSGGPRDRPDPRSQRTVRLQSMLDLGDQSAAADSDVGTGQADSLAAAKAAFLDAWERFYDSLTAHDVQHWHHHQDARQAA